MAVLGSSLQRSKPSPYPSRARCALVRRVVLAVLVILALALLTISFRSPTSGYLHDAQSYGSDALRPFQVAAVRVARPFRDGYNYVDSLARAKSRNAKLEKMVRDYRAQALLNASAVQQNNDLKQLLQFESGPTVSAGLPRREHVGALVPVRIVLAADRHRRRTSQGIH